MLWKETALPLWRAIDRRWKRNVIFVVSSVMNVMHLLAIFLLDDHFVPHTGCLHCKWVEGVSAGQFGILVNLVPCCLKNCYTWLG